MLDADIREPLFVYLETRYGKIRILEEKNIGKSRADALAVTDGAFIGVEIKSDGDTYTRLKSQVRDYNKYCNLNYIAVGESHKKHVEEHIPPFWGILVIFRDSENHGVHIEELKAAQSNPKAVLKHQMSLLWRNELAGILRANKMPKYTNLSKKTICERLMGKIPPETLLLQITDELFERDYTVYD